MKLITQTDIKNQINQANTLQSSKQILQLLLVFAVISLVIFCLYSASSLASSPADVASDASSKTSNLEDASLDRQSSLPPHSGIVSFLQLILKKLVNIGEAILFFDINPYNYFSDNSESEVGAKPVNKIPALIVWLIMGGLYFTAKLRLANLRFFGHALAIVRGKYDDKHDEGEVSHFQALCAAVSATVGLGNIGSVAIAVATGGPGAVFWMMLAGFLGMSTKMAEVTLGQKYRTIDKNGKVTGGAFLYLSEGLKEINMPKLGRVLAVIFAIFCIGGALGGGNMFQANQAVAILTSTFTSLLPFDMVIALIIAVSVAIVLIGGIKRIAIVASRIVPFMAILYIASAILILVFNINSVPSAVMLIITDAFSGKAVAGGLLGALIVGFQRAAFSNEAGLGSSPIAHAAAKTKEPAREGIVAMLEPFIDTIVICFLTGLVITVTGVYTNEDLKGVELTSKAFATVSSFFPLFLAFAVVLFAFSTMITWSYYGERAWVYLFGPDRKLVAVYHVLFSFFTFLGGVTALNLVIGFSDLLLLAMSIPNLLGLYLLSSKISAEIRKYKEKYINN